MRPVKLERSGLVTSRLGFGAARLHWCETKVRRRLIDTAFDAGFLHFDTAPCYGDTLSEIELGLALAGRREHVVLATKYGVPADRLIAAAPNFAGTLRLVRAFSRKIGLRPQLPPFSSASLRLSLEGSLRRLRTDYVDLLLLHEPTPGRIPDRNELFDALAEVKLKGLARSVGLAGDWTGIEPLESWAEALNPVIQTNEHQWPPDRVPDITYGAVVASAQGLGQKGISPIEAEQNLLAALNRRPDGVVLVSTTKPQRLIDLAVLAERSS